MANEKVVTLDQLATVKAYINANDAKAIKSGNYADNKISLYTTSDKSGTAAIEIDLPEEMFLDQSKTTFVGEFAWSEAAYPGSTDPNLDGKPVLVLAVKGDDSVTYSFVSIESLVKVYTGEGTATATITVADGKIKSDVKVSAEAGNALVAKTDGLYVEEASASADEGNVLEKRADGFYVPASAAITYATDEEVKAMFPLT